ncbi:TniB family NTP-binding protein [Kitasatospora sp. NPDC059973]|uniref:TniB family NTP-binding protein n=1 Tax=Kitasatospora sp. NPDC059973 TaxID=3347020 RepID=UPI003696845A
MNDNPAERAGQDRDASPTTWESFRRFADEPPLVPPAPGDPPRSVEERLAYHSRFVTVRTPAVVKTLVEVRTLMALGRYQQATARPSLIVTGPPTTGKTTTLLEVGRTWHLAEQAQASRGASQVPVAYLLVPPGASAKALALEFARYLGIPVSSRMTQAQIAASVCHTYNTAGVRLVMIDEIHRLNPRTSTGAEAADFLKDLTERISATFVYAGIDVTATALFSGTAGAQLAGRAELIDCDPLPVAARTSMARAGGMGPGATGRGRRGGDRSRPGDGRGRSGDDGDGREAEGGSAGSGQGTGARSSGGTVGRNSAGGGGRSGSSAGASGGAGKAGGTVLIRPFRETVAAMEMALDLQQHRPGTLVRLAPYLHERTAGRIGSLSRLLRRAAITAILDGREKITRAGLDAIALDHLAEEHYRPRHPARRSPRANTSARHTQ